jgi:hypothetical protein
LAVLDERGATCRSLDRTHYTYPPDPPQGERVEIRGKHCEHRIPQAVRPVVGGNPDRPFEECFGQATDVVGKPYGTASATPEEEQYGCGVLVNPGTDAAPNLATWYCARSQYRSSRFGSKTDENWTAKKTDAFPQSKFPSLEACLAPRVLLAAGTAAGVRVTCSHTCTIRLSVTPRSSSRVLARTRERVPYGKQQTVRLRIPKATSGAGASAVKATLRVSVAAAGSTRTARVRAAASRGRLKIPRTVIGFGD